MTTKIAFFVRIKAGLLGPAEKVFSTLDARRQGEAFSAGPVYSLK